MLEHGEVKGKRGSESKEMQLVVQKPVGREANASEKVVKEQMTMSLVQAI